jgi:TPR repeat protein/serine/threonine protein kinase
MQAAQIGKYQIERKLGEGGFGEVFLARDPKLDVQVAIKVFRVKDDEAARQATSASGDAGQILRQRFLDEARILHQLSSNPYIVNIRDFDEMPDGTPYYVMNYLPRSLVDEIGKDVFSRAGAAELPAALQPRPLPLPRALAILQQVLLGLTAVHQAGLVHRDIKPANILFDDSGKVQLTDFGIAKLPDTEHSQSGLGMGSRNYMSPEQRESAKHVSAASDVYSVGVLAYRMLTGALPIGRFDDPIRFVPALAPAVNQLILAAISSDEHQRPANAGEMLSRLQQALASQGEATAGQAEQTGTFVQGSGATLKSELKPLQQKIAELLKTEGMVDSSQLKALSVAADIAGVSEADLTQLIDETKTAQPAAVQSFIKWREKVESSKSQHQGNVPNDEREALLAGGVLLGKTEAELARFLPVAASGKSTASTQKSSQGTSNHSEPKKPNKGLLAAGIATILLAGGGYYGYSSYQQLEAERTKDLSAWQQAKLADTTDAYQQYLNQVPEGQYRLSATEALEQLKEAQLAAEKLAKEQQQQKRAAEQTATQQAQQWLIKLGYELTAYGELDARTKAAIEKFEASEKMLVTGVVDATLMTKLEQVYWRNDEKAFEKAKATHNEQSYQQYLDTRADGKYRTQATQGIETVQKELKQKAITEAKATADIKKLEHLAADKEGAEAKELRIKADHAYFTENINLKALELYQQASKLGSVYADAMLAIFYVDGNAEGIEKNVNLARQYRNQVEQKLKIFGNLNGYENFLLGYLAEKVEQDYEVALTYYKKGAEFNNDKAQTSLGGLYFFGHGVKQSYSEALLWYQKAAKHGNISAQNSLGFMYEKGHGVAQSDKDAVAWFQKTAERGNAIGQIKLGQMYEKGNGVLQSISDAVRWYRKAAELGHPYAQNQLATMYLEGNGVPKSEIDAFKWVRMAADRPGATPTAQLNFATLYKEGRGTVQSYSEALSWCRKAAEQGHALAQFRLADYYYNGLGVPQSYGEAFYWFSKAAEQGHASAQHSLAVMYFEGNGVPKSESEAVVWFKKSAKQGDKNAQDKLQKLGFSW